MSGPVDRVAGFVDALLRDRRPPRFPADDEEAEALLGAAALRPARSGADLPRAEFVEELGRRLVEAPSPGRRFTRRRVLAYTGTAAAAAAAGVAIDRLALHREPARPARPELALPNGRWVRVTDISEVGPGQAMRFSSAAVEGFIVNFAGQVFGLSAVCTHMGCIVRFNSTAGRLDCPCHGASFSLDGSPLNREYLTALPRLQTRLNGTAVEVLVDGAA